MRQFAIIGGTFWGNRGAEAMVSATMGRVRDRVPDASFLVLSYYPTMDRRLAARPGIEVDDAAPRALVLFYVPFAMLCWLFRLVGLRWPGALLPARVRRLRDCAALFDVSGISFHDGRIAIVAYNAFCLWPALLLGVPVIRLSQAMGPFRHPLNRIPARWVTRASRHTFARGRITGEHMLQLGVPQDRWSIASDIAFSFQPGDSVTKENDGDVAALMQRLATLKGQGKRVIALSPSSVVLGKTRTAGIDYVALLKGVVDHLNGLGHHVLVLPNATRQDGEGGRNNDFTVIRLLKEAVEAGGVAAPGQQSWVLFDLNTDSIRKLIAESEILITSRFHAMIAGLVLGVPTFVIGWSHKYQEVLETFGCEDAQIDFAAMKAGLIPAIDKMLAERETVAERIVAARPAVVASSMKQFEAVDSLPQ